MGGEVVALGDVGDDLLDPVRDVEQLVDEQVRPLGSRSFGHVVSLAGDS